MSQTEQVQNITVSPLDLLKPPTQFHEAEQLELKKIFSNPLVVSYLRHLGEADNKDLLSLQVLDMPADLIARRHTMIQSRLSAYATLLVLSTQGV